MFKMPLICLSIALTVPGHVIAQALPSTDVWLAGLEDGVPTAPIRISDGDGYNNQPHFSPDGTVVYYTREVLDETGAQTDIAAFAVATSTTTMLTQTAESEYSPTPIPGRDAISVIQADLEQKQLLWAIDTDNGNMELLFPAIEPVGYHAWYSERSVAMFILGDQFTLQTASLDAQDASLAATNIGRTLRKHPVSGEVLFVDKNSTPWEIAAYEPKSGVVKRLLPLFPGGEDFTIDNQGNFWTGNGSKLYKRGSGDERWILMADFSDDGVSNITRLAVHLDSGKIALVGIQDR